MPRSESRTCIEIPRSLHAELRQQAEKEGVPATAILMRLIRDGQEYRSVRLQALQTAMQAVGRA